MAKHRFSLGGLGDLGDMGMFLGMDPGVSGMSPFGVGGST